MKFSLVNESNANGTCLQGYVEAEYDRLVEVFGKPNSEGDGYKVDWEWVVKFEDGTVATVYNYKDGPNYNGGYGSADNIRLWHVGGEDRKAFHRVGETLKTGRAWTPAGPTVSFS